MLCSIPPWTWMAFMSKFVLSEFVELSPPLTSSTVLIYHSQQHSLLSLVFYTSKPFFSCLTSCCNINIHHIHICSDCLYFNNKLNFYYCHKFPMKYFLHLSKLRTICYCMSIQTIDVASI